MKKTIFVPFAEWAPDVQDYDDLEDTADVNLPMEARGGRLVPGRGFVLEDNLGNAFSGAGVTLVNMFQGGFSCISNSGEVFNIIASSTQIKKVLTANGTPTDLSRTVGGAYTLTSGGMWDFARFGDTIYGTNINDTLQAMPMTGTDFADVTVGTPPLAAHIGVVRDFVVLGNLNEVGGSGRTNNRVRWSAINNPASWTVNAATQADYQDLPDTGEVMAIVGGEFGIIICERAIWKMSYVGTPVIFQFDKVIDGIGALTHGKPAVLGDYVYFLSNAGFKRLSLRDLSIDHIGNHKVDRYFLEHYSQAASVDVSAAADGYNREIWFAHRKILRPYIFSEVSLSWRKANQSATNTAEGVFQGTAIPNSSSMDVANGFPQARMRIPLLFTTGNDINLRGSLSVPSSTSGTGGVITTGVISPFGGARAQLLEARIIQEGGPVRVISNSICTVAYFKNETDASPTLSGGSLALTGGEKYFFRCSGDRFRLAYATANTASEGHPVFKGVELVFTDGGR